jgi:seryl-tRNA synthetase
MDLKVILSNPEKIKKSQFDRLGKNDENIDIILESYNKYTVLLFDAEQKRYLRNKINKEIGIRKKKGEKETSKNSDKEYNINEIIVENFNIDELFFLSNKLIIDITKNEEECKNLKLSIDTKLVNIGNIIHESVPISMNEDNNVIVKTFGNCLSKEGLMHPDIMSKLGMDTSSHITSNIVGNRGYYLKGDMFLLQQGIIQYALQFLIKKNYEPVYTPFFMKKSAMDKVCQLSDYDESLYNLGSNETTKNIDKEYLIATSEQPMVAYYENNHINKKNLPIKHASISTCFRKEAGSSGKDTLGIFRVHQFEKIEQFCITSNENNDSWEMMEEMLKNSEEFYQSLGIEYRIVNIVSGALNNAAAKKYDLEAWFPISKSFKELVSCSNCTDYQSRNVNCIVGEINNTGNEKIKNYVHMLNATLCAVTRTMCCICETHQTEKGVKVPDVLVPFIGKELLEIK